MKFGPWAPPNCLKIKANGATKTKLLQRFSKSHDFLEILRFLDPKLDPKIIKIRFENEVEKILAFGSQIYCILEQFWGRKSTEQRPSWRKVNFAKNLVFA